MADNILSKILSIAKANFSFFTFLPFEASEKDIEVFSRNFWTASLFGVFLGVCGFAVWFFLSFILPREMTAVLTSFSIWLFSRFLHTDALADLADAFLAPTRESKIKALKDPHIGVGGVVAVIFAFSINSLCIYNVGGIFLIPAQVLSKSAMVFSAFFGNPAPTGIGRVFAQNTTLKDVVISSCLSSSAVFFVSSSFWDFEKVVFLLAGLPSFALLISFFISRWANQKLGFTNGEVRVGCGEIVLSLSLLLFVTAARSL